MKTIKTLFIAGTFATLSALSAPVWADGTMDHSKMGDMKMAQGSAAGMTIAEVRKVDTAQGKVTLKHGEIKSLDMPPMTMVFSVKDKGMLDNIKAGDKVNFTAISDGGKLIVTTIEAAK